MFGRYEPVGTGFLRCWRCHFDYLCVRGSYGDDLTGGLVFAETFESARPHHAVGRPTRELDLSHQFGLQPVNSGSIAWRVGTLERIFVDRERLQTRENLRDNVRAEASADTADIDEMVIAIDSREQRTEAFAFAGPAAENDFLIGAALGFAPVALTRTILFVELFRDDAFERHLPRAFEHRFAGCVEMFDVADR